MASFFLLRFNLKVCTREEFDKINRVSKKSENLKADLLSRTWEESDIICQDTRAVDKIDENLKKALDHKNKLINFDRSSEKRTQVIDDESDYFNTNSKWLSQKEKILLKEKEEKLREKKNGSKINKSFTFDFAGRKIIDDQYNIDYNIISREVENILNEKNVINNKQNDTSGFLNAPPRVFISFLNLKNKIGPNNAFYLVYRRKQKKQKKNIIETT